MADEALLESDFFRAGDPETLPLLQGLDKRRRRQEAVVSSHVEPGKSASHPLDVKLTPFKIDSNDIGDLQSPSRRRLEICRYLNHLRIAEVESRHCPV